MHGTAISRPRLPATRGKGTRVLADGRRCSRLKLSRIPLLTSIVQGRRCVNERVGSESTSIISEVSCVYVRKPLGLAALAPGYHRVSPEQSFRYSSGHTPGRTVSEYGRYQWHRCPYRPCITVCRGLTRPRALWKVCLHGGWAIDLSW